MTDSGAGLRAYEKRLSAYRRGVAPDVEWRELSLCGLPSADPEWWFADAAPEKAEARRWCQICPVRAECLSATMTEEWGIADDMRFGIRAGMSGPDRARLARGGRVVR